MISDSKAQGGCAAVVGGEQELSVETERPSQRPCCLLGQLKLTTIHIAGRSLQNLILASGHLKMFLSALWNLPRVRGVLI